VGKEKEISGGEALTTNNRMELRGVIEGLKALKYPCEVIVTTDSKYVCDGAGWAKGWKARGWLKSDGNPAANADLWEELLSLCDSHKVRFIWVKGHDSHPENIRCDRLAVAAANRFKV
jgi:ribonuclease HI